MNAVYRITDVVKKVSFALIIVELVVIALMNI